MASPTDESAEHEQTREQLTATDTAEANAERGKGPGLGARLCWAVVFADIGTSVYYTPGILYGHVGTRAALFVGMTLVVLVLLTVKYADVAVRCPGGGGVVTVASRALGDQVGPIRRPQLMEIIDPYLDDIHAQSMLSVVAWTARQRDIDTRLVYLPASSPPGSVQWVVDEMHPEEPVILEGGADLGGHRLEPIGGEATRPGAVRWYRRASPPAGPERPVSAPGVTCLKGRFQPPLVCH